jgi:hypothetical protein
MGTVVLGGSKVGDPITLGGPGVDSRGVERVAEAMLQRAGENTAGFLARSAELHTALVGTLRELTVGQLGTGEHITRALQHRQLPDLIAACKGQIGNETTSARAMEQISAIAERGSPTAELKSALQLQNEANARIASKIEADLTPILHPNSLRKNSEAILDAALQEYGRSFLEKPEGVVRHLQLMSRELRNCVDESTGLVDPSAIRTLAIQAQAMPTMRLRGSDMSLFDTSHKAVLAQFFETVNAQALQLGEHVQTARHLMSALSMELPPRELSLPTPEQRVGAAPLVHANPDPFAQGLDELAELRRRPIDRPIRTVLGAPIEIGQCGAAEVSLAPVKAGELRVGTSVSFYFPRIGATFSAQDFSPWYSELAASGSEAESTLRRGIAKLAESARDSSGEELVNAVQRFIREQGLMALASGFSVRSPVAGFEAALNSGSEPAFGYIDDLPRTLANALKDTFSIKLTPQPETKIIGTNGHLKSVELQCTGAQPYSLAVQFGPGSSTSGVLKSIQGYTVRDGSDVRNILSGLLEQSASNRLDKSSQPLDTITGKLLRQGQVTEARNLSVLQPWEPLKLRLAPNATIEKCSIACGEFSIEGAGARISKTTVECTTGSITMDRAQISSSKIVADGTLAGTISRSQVFSSTLAGKENSALSLPNTTYSNSTRTGFFKHGLVAAQ